MNRKKRRTLEKQRTRTPANPAPANPPAPEAAPAPDAASAGFEQGLQFHQAGRLAEAEAVYRQVLQADADDWRALHLLGVLHYQTGRAAEAIELIGRAIQINPNAPEPWSNRGLVLVRCGRPQEATPHLQRALNMAPNFADAWSNLGLALLALGRAAEATAAFQRSLALKPGHVEAQYNFGVALKESGRLDEAIAQLESTVAANPNHVDALGHLGAALRDRGRLGEAATLFQRVVELRPDFAQGHTNLGVVLKDQGRIDEARTRFHKAWELNGDPAMLLKATVALPVIPGSVQEIHAARQRLLDSVNDFRARGLTLANPFKQVGQTCFYLAYHALDDLPLQKAVAEMYMAACPSLVQTAPHCREPEPLGGRRIRIGFVSEHFFTHTIGQLNHGLMRVLPKDRFHLTLFATPRPLDRLRQAMVEACDQVVDLPLDLDLARQRIAEQKPDLLYFTDIGMTPFTYFLAFSRLAPVQTVTWGHPDTTGIPNLDYFISCDAQEPPGAERHYTETLVRLPGPTVFYPRLAFAQPMKDRAALGLPEDANLYVCPQSLFKFHPDFDPLLVEILRRDPKGVLVLVQGKDRHTADLLVERIGRTGPDVTARILALPPMSTLDFIAVMACSDVMLDPLHYSGGNTSLEALTVGTPIVTWPGEFMRGRHTLGWYKLMGLEDAVARDWHDYVEIALRLGTDRDARADLSRRIREANHVLYENRDTARAIAEFLAAAVTRRIGT